MALIQYKTLSMKRQLNKSGFTLIELIVAVGILILILSVGMANYITFNKRQKLNSTASEIQSYIQLAQSKAESSEIPAVAKPCNELQYYGLRTNVDGINNSLELTIHCSNYVTGPILLKSYPLPAGVVISPFDLQFQTLYKGIADATDDTKTEWTITVSDDPEVYRFILTSGGEINDQGL